ncbi:hypothetical protein I316_07501 [Kwoniella heveanensis BCC8398]|uniref:Glutamine amidotransferase domain-containing protein n=1 Tax=Kwoniella heveanensis BCC8398 TaxID=1296120 RepID=A0A1B9GIR0_9TREE|nr:hypothetical protein I316_07501 [Kwoniella heveanensis BCC8398]
MSSVTPEPSGKLTVAFFKCDSLEKESIEKHGEYQDVLHNLFEPLLPEHLKLETLTYDVLEKREYPKDEELDRIDAIVISGSFEDEAHSDTRWILKLAGYLIKIYDEHPRIRILGICFGLQVIARAFGPSRIQQNPKGWEVGSTRVDLTDIGRKIIWHDGEGEHNMQQIHSDIVTEVPPDFELLGKSEICPVQGIVAFYPEDRDPPAFTHSHAHTLPSHPEWHEDILIPFIDNYEKDGTFDAEFAEKARKQSKAAHDGERVGRILLRVLGVA